MHPTLAPLRSQRLIYKIMAKYAHMSREELAARLAAYEGTAGEVAPIPADIKLSKAERKEQQRRADGKDGNAAVGKKAASRAPPAFQFNAAPTRHIAILVAYHGWPYSGLALQPTITYPTVEGELLKALEKTRLIPEGGGWEACEFSRCGRTDRGVSGEGQVLNLWVRSDRNPNDGGHFLGDGWRPAKEEKVARNKPAPQVDADGNEIPRSPPMSPKAQAKALAREKAKAEREPLEMHYPRRLNQVLPPEIRVLAWSPIPADFDARFSCTYRHYKYTFHRHAVCGDAPLDLDLMNEGAALLIGEHDFRNFCRLDGSKQIENHSRGVLKAYFEPGPMPDQIIFNLIGTAFLWHQVRHIIAVLFLIGARLEPPTLVTDLLDVSRFPGKPAYEMGDPLPLTLHECGYAPDTLDWRYGPYDGPWASLAPEEKDKVRHLAELGREGLERQLDSARQEAETRAWQVGGALRVLRATLGEDTRPRDEELVIYPTGAGTNVPTKKYRHVVERKMAEGPDVVNARWREKKGEKREEAKRGEESK